MIDNLNPVEAEKVKIGKEEKMLNNVEKKGKVLKKVGVFMMAAMVLVGIASIVKPGHQTISDSRNIVKPGHLG